MASILAVGAFRFHVIRVTILAAMRSVRSFTRRTTAAALVYGLTIATVVVGPFAVGLATAQDNDDTGDLRQEREDNRREAAAVAAELDELSAEDDTLIDAIAALDAYISLQEIRIDAAEVSIGDAELRVTAARTEATALSTEMDTIRARLRDRAIEVFVSPRLDTLEQLNSDDLLDAELKQTYVDEVVGDEHELIDQLRTAEAAKEKAERDAQDAAEEAEAERAELADRLADLDASRAEADDLRAEVAVRVDQWEAVGREIEAADDAIEIEIRALEAELARQVAAAEQARLAAQEEARLQAAAAEAEAEAEADGDASADDAVDEDVVEDTTPVALGPFAVTHRPVPGGVSSSFGPRLHPIFGTVRNHYGLDFRAQMGETISAAADGVVLSAGWMNGYGRTTVVSHGDGFTTLYAHQSVQTVEPGDTVSGGQAIGQVGSSGFSTGPHLHWEIRVDGVAVDPAPYL
jgi:murein DD-endopeptidase MepM/ murein hydrolase activator NlpD